jgi:hypothetical protein
VDRFRVAARKVIAFRAAIAKLGPAYQDCNEWQSSCTRRKAQPTKGCPDCEYTIRHAKFLEELDEQLKNIKHGTRKGGQKWPRKLLLKQLTEVATFANSQEGIDPTWAVTSTHLISIYRGEEAKKRAIDTYVPPSATTPKGPMLKDED